MNSIVLDQGSVNCLDTGVCCGDNCTCVCVKGASFPSQTQLNMSPRGENVETQQPGRERVLGWLLLIWDVLLHSLVYARERILCWNHCVYIPAGNFKGALLLKYMCILCIQYAPVINIYFLSGKLIIIVVPDATVLCFRGWKQMVFYFHMIYSPETRK